MSALPTRESMPEQCQQPLACCRYVSAAIHKVDKDGTPTPFVIQSQAQQSKVDEAGRMWEQAHKKKVLPTEWFIATPAEHRRHAHGTAAIEVQLEARSSDKQAPAQTAPLSSTQSDTDLP